MTGHSAALARRLAQELGADAETLRERRPRHGFSGVVRALFDAIGRRFSPIEAPERDPGDYDWLILGGPVWAGRMASPIRTYARDHASRAPRLACFCTQGGHGADKAFAELAHLTGLSPQATLVVSMAEPASREAEARFIGELRTLMARHRQEPRAHGDEAGIESRS